MILTAIGIDIMLPAFAEIRKHFSLEESTSGTPYIVTVFFAGQALQLVFGPLSDCYGRLPILRIGFALYIVAGLAAALSNSMPVMLVWRFVGGAGASAVFMTTIAVVRDHFSGDKMARTMSLIFTIFLFTPVVAPFLGAAILTWTSWKFVFLTPPIFAVIVAIWSLRMKESLPPSQHIKLNSRSLAISFSQVLSNRNFCRYTAVTTLLFGGISAYVSNSEFLVGSIYRKPGQFSVIFATVGIVMAAGALVNTWLAGQYGSRRVIRALILVYTIIAGILFLVTYLVPQPPIVAFFTGIALLLGINMSIEPNSSALAMKAVGEAAGTASSIYGTTFFFVGALIGSAISFFLKDTLLVMPLGYLLIGMFCTILVLTASEQET
ncbi:MFS transporter, DHA1 family, bicyclomycin/chloramphenicol resistance protein [Dyadobacter soli]|uniref:MFS transporter, DHA1 family, bicyclomycin/chloramphenicol resistance protein n=2 Tax=Dyadobacter soli TaxID=659014 RepID=A0A1G7MCU7_9BACT|nr:MFS transporter, DHA1 family, bicyclomycin/chloramphenicol resistance protein [Dyadobacter soli]